MSENSSQFTVHSSQQKKEEELKGQLFMSLRAAGEAIRKSLSAFIRPSSLVPRFSISPNPESRIPNPQKGFTLIEVLVVVFILGILAALVGPKIIGRTDDAKIAEAKLQIKNLETALKLYKLDNGMYPTTDQGLGALIAKPSTEPVPKKYKEEGYLEKKRVPKDPWGNPFIYISPGSHGDFDIISYGGDGKPGGEKKDADINSWDMD